MSRKDIEKAGGSWLCGHDKGVAVRPRTGAPPHILASIVARIQTHISGVKVIPTWVYLDGSGSIWVDLNCGNELRPWTGQLRQQPEPIPAQPRAVRPVSITSRGPVQGSKPLSAGTDIATLVGGSAIPLELVRRLRGEQIFISVDPASSNYPTRQPALGNATAMISPPPSAGTIFCSFDPSHSLKHMVNIHQDLSPTLDFMFSRSISAPCPASE
jgi:hypothetical protein